MTNRDKQSTKLLSGLNDALKLIEEKSEYSANLTSSMKEFVNLEIKEAEGLLARCESALSNEKKPKLRVIHHLACSGGTLITKCISALPNVYVLSEVHPNTYLGRNEKSPKYAPSDIASLAAYAKIPNYKELANNLFLSSVSTVYEHVQKFGGVLVVRDHTHADYCSRENIPTESRVITALKEKYDISSILTIRNPIDSYTSLLKNNWIHFEPPCFDEYCRRVVSTLEGSNGANIFKYEDFVSNPQKQMKMITKALDLPFDNSFEDLFCLFKVTGDSGRKGNEIYRRPRVVEQSLLEKYQKTKSYIDFCNKYKLYGVESE